MFTGRLSVMKKILGLVLVLCLVFTFAADALAVGKPQFKTQPQSATTDKKGTVKFSVKVSGAETVSWFFQNPATGETTTGRKITNIFKKLKVSGPNKSTIILKKVPEEMHGWYVWCHVTGNGYKVDSNKVVLNVYGKEPAPEPVNPAPAASDDSGSSSDSGKGKSKGKTSDEAPAPADAPSVGDGKTVTEDGYLLTTDDDDDKGIDREADVIADKPITVTASANVLYKMNSLGKVEGDEASKSLDFINSGSFLVKSGEPIKNWTINGMRIEPAEPVYEFKVTNVTDNVALNLTISRAPASSQNLDTSNMVNVTCQGCTFSYNIPTLVNVTQGKVPAGAYITVICSDLSLLPNGYSVNGGAPDHQGLASFRMQITEDTNIVIQGASDIVAP